MAAMANLATNATAETAEQVETETLDHVERRRNHPLYLHNSDTLGCVLTSVQLTGTENYSLWSRSMLINLRAKSKLGFVLGTCRKGDYRGEMEEQWEKCNTFVLAWIMNTVSKELLSSIVYATDAVMVWVDLKKRFDKVDGSRCYQLHRDICTLSQGNMSVSAYFSKLRLLWDEFDALVPLPSCNCDKSRIYIDHITCLRLFSFLMGLNEMYTHARTQILMMNPLPTVGKAYAMIIVNFFPQFFVLQDLSTGRVKGIGKEIGGLYYLPAISTCEDTTVSCEGAKGNQVVMTTALQCSSRDEML